MKKRTAKATKVTLNQVTPSEILIKIDRRAEAFRRDEAQATQKNQRFRADMSASFARQWETFAADLRADIAAHGEAVA